MSKDFESAFIYGYMYSKAEDIKKEGYFKDLSVKKLALLLIKKSINNVINK